METARDREVLDQLTELALEVAVALKARIVTETVAGNAESADRLSLAFTRVSRSIRQTIAFKAKLAEIHAKSAEKCRAKEREQAIEMSRLRVKKQQVGCAITRRRADDFERAPPHPTSPPHWGGEESCC